MIAQPKSSGADANAMKRPIRITSHDKQLLEDQLAKFRQRVPSRAPTWKH